MAIEVMSWVMENSKAENSAEQLLLLLIANHTREDGTNSFPHIETLARRAKMNKNSVSRILSRMEEKGLIKIYRMPGYGNIYHVVMPGIEQPEPSFAALIEKRKRGGKQAAATPSGVVEYSAAEKLGTRAELNGIWDALTEVCGADSKSMTKAERGKYGKVVKALKLCNATPADIRARAFVYRRKFPNAALTATALSSHWSSLDPKMATITNNGPEGWIAIQAARMERTENVIEVQ